MNPASTIDIHGIRSNFMSHIITFRYKTILLSNGIQSPVLTMYDHATRLNNNQMLVASSNNALPFCRSLLYYFFNHFVAVNNAEYQPLKSIHFDFLKFSPNSMTSTSLHHRISFTLILHCARQLASYTNFAPTTCKRT